MARLAELVVNAVRPFVVGPALAQLEAAQQLGVDRVRELLDLFRRHVACQLVRREASMVEDLVCPGTADAGDHALVAQHRMQPP